MVEKLFVLGCSGSGKSTVSRYIAMLARDSGWSVHLISDYGILYEMFLADTKCEKFDHADHSGFDVLDMSVYDTALDKLNIQTQALIENAEGNELVIIEFARYDYSKALKHFDGDFLRTAHFLFLDAEIDTCVQRVRERIVQPGGLDDHFVPDHVIECFGQKSNRQYIESGLKLDFGIGDERVRILDSGGPIEELMQLVKQFIDTNLPVLVFTG